MFVAFVVALPVGWMLWNNIRLYQIGFSFNALHHPQGTAFVERFERMGAFDDLDRCIFLVAEVRSYTCSKESIVKCYDGCTVPSSVGMRRAPIEVHFGDDPIDEITSEALHNAGLEANGQLFRSDFRSGKYYVLLYGQAADACMDLRCVR